MAPETVLCPSSWLAQVYRAAGRGPAANIELLEQMLLARREMADMVGCSSYSKYKAWGAR